MKNFILFFTLIIFNIFHTRAQVLTIDPGTQSVELQASDFTEADANVTNVSAATRNFKWILVVDNQPTGWTFSVCDNNTCYAPNAVKPAMQVVLDPNQTCLMKLNLWPNEISGTASYHLVFYDVNDSANANITMYVNATADPTGISDVSTTVISVYPNPVKSTLFMNFDAAKHITSVDIHNMVGQKVKTIAIEEGTKSLAIPVSDLKKGIYFLRVFSGSKELTTKTFSKD